MHTEWRNWVRTEWQDSAGMRLMIDGELTVEEMVCGRWSPREPDPWLLSNESGWV